jgi:signal recognition particle subunit SRP54
MFEKLSDKLSNTFRKLSGRTSINEADLKEAFRSVRLALLEADVNYKVVKDFLISVGDKALGQQILKSLTPGQQVINIVYEELTEMMGSQFQDLDLTSGTAPHTIMLVGLQGSGKTTTAGKLALYLKKKGRNPYLVPADVARPAAIIQLTKLGEDLDVPVYPSTTDMSPVDIAKNSISAAALAGRDVILIDTAGRLSIDQNLMEELEKIKTVSNSSEILLVADAMTGQEAVNIASDFNKRLALTGVILTKMEGDARGGAAMSVKAVTDTPLKFIGIGEKMEALEPFHPDRMASLILGMGDLLSLIEKAKEEISDEEAQKMNNLLLKGKFTLNDFRKQLRTINKIGGLSAVLSSLPLVGKLKMVKQAMPDNSIMTKMSAIIDSMTLAERRDHRIIDNSRRKRIAKGSGTNVSDVNGLLTNYTETLKLIKQTTRSGGMDALRRSIMSGNLPNMKGPKPRRH